MYRLISRKREILLELKLLVIQRIFCLISTLIFKFRARVFYSCLETNSTFRLFSGSQALFRVLVRIFIAFLSMIEVVKLLSILIHTLLSKTIFSLHSELIPLRSLLFRNINNSSISKLRFLLLDILIRLLISALFHI